MAAQGRKNVAPFPRSRDISRTAPTLSYFSFSIDTQRQSQNYVKFSKTLLHCKRYNLSSSSYLAMVTTQSSVFSKILQTPFSNLTNFWGRCGNRFDRKHPKLFFFTLRTSSSVFFINSPFHILFFEAIITIATEGKN